MKMLWRLIVVFMCWELTPVNTASFSFFVQFDKYMNYKALSMYKPECHSYWTTVLFTTDHEWWRSDVTGPARKPFYFKPEENKGAIWSHVSVKLKWSSCQIKPTITQMREKLGFKEVVFLFPSASSLFQHNLGIFLLLLLGITFLFCLKPATVSDVHASNTGSWLCRGLLFPISYGARFLFVGNWHLLWNVHQRAGHRETWGNKTT